MATPSTPTIVDLFSGCGGFGLGAELAGFSTIAAVDIDADLQAAYRLNFPGTKVLQADVAEMTEAAWAFPLAGQRPDGVIGGPPCQGFSRIGKRRKDDPRNTLIGRFFHQINLLQPKFFVMENVEGLLDEGNVDSLNEAIATVPKRYSIVGPFVVHASQFGAATIRKRVVVVGFDPNEMNPITEADLQPKGIEQVDVRAAIADLPSPIPQRDGEYGWARYPIVDADDPRISTYARRMRAAPDDKLGWSAALERLAHGEVSGLAETLHTEAVKVRFGQTAQGRTEEISRYPRLDWDGLCPTLRAGTGRDKGSFQSMRPIHPSEPRVITVREAARLQGFPDWFCFSYAKWHSFRMIGNSVSPIVAKHLLSEIKHRLISNDSSRERAGATGG
ncbi:DNA (cytosine-5-)-methyltransferase [Caulobacter flavus]|uniref:Cytosine-specific methyltransferase n=1 Tax=Caulobacter flavus TaxID=1679497 RepID=A0A2N5CZF1_9CAUL|nr:DNA cytosine methyltransferase [Caulobacter flavus]AYV45184.1 DNA (cytosine-5-)-methyltransferase [Caulobacter flavus]PLR19136.1 DNA (cytosine-5-)-methyltransferase [Caulobacter flavus]